MEILIARKTASVTWSSKCSGHVDQRISVCETTCKLFYGKRRVNKRRPFPSYYQQMGVYLLTESDKLTKIIRYDFSEVIIQRGI